MPTVFACRGELVELLFPDPQKWEAKSQNERIKDGCQIMRLYTTLAGYRESPKPRHRTAEVTNERQGDEQETDPMTPLPNRYAMCINQIIRSGLTSVPLILPSACLLSGRSRTDVFTTSSPPPRTLSISIPADPRVLTSRTMTAQSPLSPTKTHKPTVVVPLDSPMRQVAIHPDLPDVKVPASELKAYQYHPVSCEPLSSEDLQHHKLPQLQKQYTTPEAALKAQAEAIKEVKEKMAEAEKKTKEINQQMEEMEKTREIERKIYMRHRRTLPEAV